MSDALHHQRGVGREAELLADVPRDRSATDSQGISVGSSQPVNTSRVRETHRDNQGATARAINTPTKALKPSEALRTMREAAYKS